MFRPLVQTSSYANGWKIRWRRSGLIQCGRSETIWSKWLSHCQVFWAAKKVDEHVRGPALNKLAQCCLICPHDCRRICQDKPWLFVFEMHLSSGVTDEGSGANRSPGKLNLKSGSHLACIFVLTILLVFSRLFFVYSSPRPDSLLFLSFLHIVGSWAPFS